jgi:hypothetical protein
MVYQQKIQRKTIPLSYFEKQEARRLKKKYPKGIPYSEYSRFGFRELSGSERRIHEKGNVIEYKGGLAKISRVTKKGIWVVPFNSESLIPSRRKVFISESSIEKGKAYPSSVVFLP